MCAVWSVAFVAGTDDIIVGSSDSLVRVFTRDPARFAPADELAAFDEAVSSSTLNASQVVGDVKKSDLASDDTLAARQGKKEGEIAMVKNAAGGVEAYQWSSADGKWVKVGQVVDAVGSGTKQLYEGKEYDFVFDVDVSEGQPPLKLPYNVTRGSPRSPLACHPTQAMSPAKADRPRSRVPTELLSRWLSQRTHTRQHSSSWRATSCPPRTWTRSSSSSRRTRPAPRSDPAGTSTRTRARRATRAPRR